MELSAYKDIPSPGPEKEEARLKFLEAEAKSNVYRKTLPSVITAVVFGAIVFLAVSYLFGLSGRFTSPARRVRSSAAVHPVVYPRNIPTPSMAAPRLVTPSDYKTQRPNFTYGPHAAGQFKNIPKPKHWKEYDIHCDPGLVGHDDCEAAQRSLIESFKATDRK